MLAIDGAGFDLSYMADNEVPINMALMTFSDSEFNKSEFNLATYKRGLPSVEEQLVFYKKNEVIFCEQLAVLKRDISYKSVCLKITDKSRKGVGFVSYNVVPPPHTSLFSPPNLDLSYSGLEEFQQPNFEGYGPKPSKSVSEDISNEVRESPDAPLVKELVSDDKLEKKIVSTTVAKIEFVRPKQQEKPVRKLANYNYHQRERVVSGNNYIKVNYNYSAKKAYPSAHMNMALREVLMKTGLRPLNTARPVNTAHPKTTVYSVRPMSHFSKSAQSTVKRPYQIITTLTNKIFSQKVNTATGKFYTARPKSSIARSNLAVVNAIRANQVNDVKASVYWVWRPTKLNNASINLKIHNYVNARGRSKHMTGNMSYLSDFKEFDGGYVTFGGGAKGEKITGKGTLKIGKLDFEDVYFVKELQFKLFSISQMCDKKNSVLFTNTGCFVLSSDFKLADESQVLLKVPRKNNMYNVDMKNIVPKESLTCLIAKATLDELMLWHRRLTHNRVLVVKPHNKTPYELFRGRALALSFMRPLGCHVTILNTLDYLGKFDGKSDEGFFVGYSMNSKAFRVYNIRTMKVEENLHISIGACHSSKEARSIQDYILMPLWKDGLLFESSSKNASNDEPQPSSDAGKKDDEGVCKESGNDDQKSPKNSNQGVNTATPSINAKPDMFSLGDNATLEATHSDFFGDETKVDMSNITTTYPVPSTLNTRIHKDHSLDHVIGDVQSSVQTKRMIKTTNEQAFISAVYEGKTHEDLHTCLFACFLSQVEPKKVTQALIDPSWIKAMQDELL
ncbi:ribonuclease H-like domain-containing protein [Tanacetum coccineum]